jgi:hypothetical protein
MGRGRGGSGRGEGRGEGRGRAGGGQGGGQRGGQGEAETRLTEISAGSNFTSQCLPFVLHNLCISGEPLPVPLVFNT